VVSSRRVRRTVFVLAGVVAAFAVLGFLVAPPIVRSQLEKRLAETLHRPVSIERVRISPFTLAASVEQLRVGEREGDATALSFEALDVDVAYQSLIRLAPVVQQLRITRPYLRVVRNDDRRYNFQDLLDEFSAPPAQPPPPDKPPPQFALFNIELIDGRIDFDDRPEKTVHAVTEIGIGVPFVSSIPSQVDIRVQPRLSAKVNGAPFELTGETKPFKDTHETTLRLELDGLSIAKYLEYSPVPLRLRVPSGQLDAKIVVSLSTLNEKLNTLALSGSAALRNLALQSGDGAPLLAFETLRIELESLDLVGRKASVKSVALQAPDINVVRTKDGNLNWLGLVPPEKPSPDKPAPAAPGDAAPFAFAVHEIAVTGGKLHLHDATTPEPLKLEFNSLALAVRDVARTGERDAPIKAPSVKLEFATDARGKVSFDGVLQALPLKGGGQLAVEGFRLPVLAAYYDQWLNVVVNGGAVATKGTLAVEQPPGQPLRASYRGDASVTGLASVDKLTSQELLRWKSLAVTGIDFQLQPLAVRVAQVTLADFYSRLIVNRDGTLNLQHLLKDNPGAGNAKTAAKTPSAEPAARIGIGRIAVKNGRVNFSDFFVKPNVSADLRDVVGSVSEMTPEKAGDLALRARLGRTAPVEVLGRINPLARDLFLDINASARDVELPPLSAYSVKYAGYGIEKGKLSLKAKYHLQNRQLTAANNIYLDQLTFGPRVESPTATKLPVTLAIALLKDRNGVIDIDLPISGSLDDPQFSVGGVIVRVIVNLLTKAVTAPFALLGALVGGGGGDGDLGYLEFAPGRAAVPAEGKTKLESLAKALQERPALKLEVSGRVDPAVDRDGLKKVLLDRQVKAQKFKQAINTAKDAAALDNLQVDPAEYNKLLTAVYRDAKFERPRNLIGMLKEVAPAEMERMILANTAVSEDDLRALADRRAQAVKAWLVDSAQIATERVFLLAPKLDASGIKDKGQPTRADFSIR
jgi:uncharacterized protein involved in outer membrane biogenesis